MSESIPLNYLFSCKGFGADHPSTLCIISDIKQKESPKNGNVYTADNTATCSIVEMLVRDDPSTLTMRSKCECCAASINPIQQLWHHYDNSSTGNKEIQYVRDNPKPFLESLNEDGVCGDKQFGGMVVVWRAMTIMARALYAFLDSEVEDGRSIPLIHAYVGIGDHGSASFLDFLLELDPNQASLLDTRGNLPVHIAAKSNEFVSPIRKAALINLLFRLHAKGLSFAGGTDNDKVPWVDPLLIALAKQDPPTGLQPDSSMLSASCDSTSSLDMTYQVLRAQPERNISPKTWNTRSNKINMCIDLLAYIY